ncbi:hypothetical protein [Rhizobium mongolense]
MTMLARTAPETPPTAALTEQEIEILDQMVSNAGNRQATPGSLNFYLTKLARLGGYLARASDPPPGNTVVWRGLSRLTDIRLGTEIAATLRCG